MTEPEGSTAAPEPKGPVDQALDLLVFAPLGFALEARTLVPKLVDRGRQQVDGQVTMARMVGQFAVRQGQSEAGKQLTKVQEQTLAVLADLGLLPRDEPQPARPERTEPRPSSPAAAPAEPSPPAEATAAPAEADVVVLDDVTLAIPDYDSLAASQVIPRLAGLAGAELDAVRAYERAKRGRKTILNKIAQLQA